MAVTLSEIEGAPEAWPEVSPYPRAALGDPYDAEVTPEAVWQVIERWVTVRWAARPVTFIAEGPGLWASRLTPFALVGAELWTGDAWTEATPGPSPFGGLELGEDIYRITGTVGDDSPVPQDAAEAWRRLHSYLLGDANTHRASALAMFSLEGGDRPRAHAAQALRLSGAADLLRPYRRIA